MKPLLRLPIPLMAAIALAACNPPPAPSEPVRSVRTMTLGSESAGGVHEYAAEIRARTESRLGFRVGGKMLSRAAEVGQRVRAGQELARLDATDLRLGQESAQAGVRAAQSAHDLAKADFRRFNDLRDQGFISAAELERRASALEAQAAQLEQARAQAGVQGNQAAYAVLAATAAGVVTAVEAEPGAVLAAGTPVLRLAHDGPRDAVFAVPEGGVEAMRALLGRTGAIKVRPWGAGAAVAATVREVAAAADPVTRTFQVKADIGRAALDLGQTVTAVVELPRRDGVVRLPLAAVMQQQGRSAVWLLDRAALTVQLQPVEVGGADGNSIIISAGLTPGQTVVTAGVHTLTPGQKVRLYQAPAAPQGAASAVFPAAASAALPSTNR
ncbi:Efflux RND transporter periplasmic adaptor subunit [Rubrivivax sp. A210]|uniref:efflux RND transporter periplasmic adaptor subunit n=1 Tax=Rubrivivax sp. A210 TaxID=2772301 RepID=UPI00191B58E0|nr:efflux RND transporter periplasmic adaptor subunit [Rubrivivax sp. A210]CAD5374705.1 Efflux RND transporter periplasmic adaptor subunit [Rubrivivax sp. A210]